MSKKEFTHQLNMIRKLRAMKDDTSFVICDKRMLGLMGRKLYVIESGELTSTLTEALISKNKEDLVVQNEHQVVMELLAYDIELEVYSLMSANEKNMDHIQYDSESDSVIIK